MRVLLVSQYFWPETFGINPLARALQDRGMEITVLTGKPNYPDGEIYSGYTARGVTREQYGGIEVIRIPLFPRGRKSSLRLTLNYLSFITSGFIYGPWLIRRRKFDAVFVYALSPLLQALPAIWLASLKRAPIVLWVQDLWPESLSSTGFVKNRVALKLVEFVVRFIYRSVDSILVPSEGFRAPVVKQSGAPAKIRYYPNAWNDDFDQSEPDDAVRELAADIASGFSVVFSGNLGTAQALDTVLSAAERLQNSTADIRFFLIGSGSQSPWLESEIKRRNIRNVLLPGRYQPSAMPYFYAAASALLVSLRDEPIFAYTIPSKMQGYLAAGKPIVASLNGEGARVVEQAGCGISSPAGDAAALASAVQSLFAMDRIVLKKMGENARRYAVANYSLDHLADKLAGHLAHLGNKN